MKIDFLSEVNPAYPEDAIFRIHDFDRREVTALREVFEDLAQGRAKEADLAVLPYVEPVDKVEMVLKVGMENEGVAQLSQTFFTCVLSREGWKEAAELTRHFCESNEPYKYVQYQWLYDLDTDIELLLSPSGRW